MILPEIRMENNTLVAELSGRIDSTVTPEIEKAIQAEISARRPGGVVLDCEQLEYISSAGLRMILRLKKSLPDTRVINVHRDVYDIFEVTGFTAMMDIEKASRVLSVEGCEVIGEGASGKVYRIDRETVIKVYTAPDALQEIRQARELSRTAFIAGIPTAISYDVVNIEGGGYGAVYELIGAKNLSALIASGEKTVDEAARISVDLLKLIHSKTAGSDSVPDAKAYFAKRIQCLKDYLPAEQYDKLDALIQAVPADDHLLHGDYHLGNIMVQGDEALIIDMESLCHGHPVFELAQMHKAYCGFGAMDRTVVEDFLGIPYETASNFWRKILRLYLGTDDAARIRNVEEKIMLLSFASIMRRAIRHMGLDTAQGQAHIRHCRSVFDELLPKVNELTFD